MAEQDLSQQAISQALKQGLRDTCEARELMGNKRQQEMQAIRASRQDSDNKEYSYKQ